MWDGEVLDWKEGKEGRLKNIRLDRKKNWENIRFDGKKRRKILDWTKGKRREMGKY